MNTKLLSKTAQILRKTALGLVLGASVAATAGASLGCQGTRDEINRVQANALRKDMFVRPDTNGAYLADSDDWYFRATIVDSPSTAMTPSYIGSGGPMWRVKWRIEEKFLLAIKSDPDIIGSGEPAGGIIAAFPIVSHFDVKHGYNSLTGEETNVLEENTSDRPWWSREYMRIDWSTNKLSEKGFVFPAYESVSAATYYVQDPNDKDHPVFENDYFDITARYVVEPDYYTCEALFRSYNCGPGTVAARLSFMKVPVRDFVPREYPDRALLLKDDGDPVRSISGNPVSLPMQDQFGAFRIERPVYDPRYGSLEKRFIYRARTWNIWQKWFKRDAANNVVYETGLDGKPDKTKPQMLPYGERKVRPIVYFLNAEWPTELHETAQTIADGWNDALQETVASLRLLEKKGDNAVISFAEMRAEVDAMKARKEDVYVLCRNNPVKEGDRAECGKPGDVARLGDQRYSFMYWVNKPQPSGPLGLGPSYADSVTGEVFSAGAHIYGAALDTLSQNALDVVNLLNGKFKPYDYINGVNTDLYAKRLAAGDVPGSKSSANPEMPAMPGEKSFDLDKLKTHLEKIIDRPLLNTIAAKGPPKADGPSGADKLKWIRGTPIERELLDNPEMKALVGKMGDEALTDDDVKKIGDMVFSSDLGEKERERLRFLGEHDCYYPVEFADDATLGIAKEMAKKYPPSTDVATEEKNQKEIWNILRSRYLQQVTEHEVGHTLSMAHNFEGSADPMNFFDEYWQLKGEKPKFGDAMKPEQVDGKMIEFQYSTVMDYTSRFNSEIHGLGKYDHAYMRFVYGDLVETFPAGKVVDKLYSVEPNRFRYLSFTGYSAELLDGINRRYRHYTQIPSEFSDGTKSLMKTGREIRRFADVKEAARQLYAGAAPDKVSQVKTGSWKKGTDPTKQIDVVPYRWCGDRLAGSVGRPWCERWDTGMDSYEIVKDAIDRYQQYYVFDGFTRGKIDGASRLRGYASKLNSRYFSHVHQQYIYWLFNGIYSAQPYFWANDLDNGGTGIANGFISDPDWFKDPGGGLGPSIATYWGLDRLVDALSVPDVGTYGLDATTDRFVQTGTSPFGCTGADGSPSLCASTDKALTLDIDSGARYRFTTYDASSGIGYYDRIKSFGSFYDKLAALSAITDSAANFVGQDTTNAASYRIGFYLFYQRGLSTVFGGIVNDKAENFGWRYEYDASRKAPKLMSVDIFTSLKNADTVPRLDTLTGKAIDPSWVFYHKAWALLLSMSQFQANFSQSWNDAVRVFCTGCGESFTPGPTTAVERVVDPLSGKEYAAIVYGDGRYSPGAELIRRAQTLAKTYAEAKALPDTDTTKGKQLTLATNALTEHVKLLDLVRGLYSVYGYTR